MGPKVLSLLVIISWILLLGLITLQIIGVRSAITGLRESAAAHPQQTLIPMTRLILPA